MKKPFKAASMATAGAAILSTLSAFAGDGSKPYTLSAGVRGFYDDNIFTANNKVDVDGDKKPDRRKFDSFGFEITPSVRFNVPLEGSTLTAGYTYGLRYYESRPGSKDDQFHLADVAFSHAFNPRYKLSVSDQFAAAQEPDQMVAFSGSGTLPQVVRAEGSNIRNSAGADLTVQIVPLWSAVVGYRNNYYNYKNKGFAEALDRMENLPSLGLRYQLAPKTVLSGNYQYGDVNYRNTKSDFRDNRSHYVFAGVDHSFTSQLVGSLRAGAQFVDWYHAPAGARADAVNPFIDANVTYSYATGSNVQIGFRHARNATDLEAASAVLDQQSSLAYGSINHQITGKLRGSVVAQYQNSEFIGASKAVLLNGQKEDYISLGLTLNYRINNYLSAEAAYYYDQLASDVNFRDYSRNRVFVGIRATY